jgi:hypothetical protein
LAAGALSRKQARSPPEILMDNVLLEHPSQQRLQAFALGQLTESELAEVEAHLGSCADCRQAAEGVADDTLIALLRSAATDPDSRAGSSPQDVRTRTRVGGASMPGASAGAIPEALLRHPRYRVVELLGVGGMGAVYRAEHLLMQRPVALKVINHELIDRPATIDRFEREVRAAARLVHPNIVTAFDAEQAGDLHFLVMEYVEGTSLARRLAEQGPLGIAEACNYIRQAALGLQHAHERGMVHRDIKPHNLMLTPDGRVKILDFGLARFAMETAPTGGLLAAPTSTDQAPSRTPESITQIGMVMGTPDYIAPEQARDAHTADIRADIYSLGCTLYDLLAGQAPFPNGTAVEKVKAHMEQTPRPVTAIRPDVPPELRKIIDRLLAKDPADRFQTPAEVAEALAPFLAMPEPMAGQSTAGAPNRPHWKWLAVAAAAAAALLLAAGTIIYVQTDKGKLVLDIADDDVAVLIDKAGGVKVIDQAHGREYHLHRGENDARTGDYQIEVSEPLAGLQFNAREFTLARGGKRRITARIVPTETAAGTKIDLAPRIAGSLDAEAFNWFPIDCTFLVGRDVRAYPGLSEQQLLVLELLASSEWKDRIWKFRAILGRVDRIVGAVAEERDHPDRLRVFVRVTGLINHQRLVDWFRTEYAFASIQEMDSQKLGGRSGESITVAISSRPDFPAAAVVNDTDVIFAADTGKAAGSAEAINQVLRVRSEGRSGPMPQFHDLWSRIMPQTWAVMMGQVPTPLRQQLTSGLQFPTLPDALVLSVGGSQTIQFRLAGSFGWRPRPNVGPAEAAAFADGIRSLQQRAIVFLQNPPAPIKFAHGTLELLEETLQSLKVETAGNEVSAQMQVREQTVAAFVDALRDLPLSTIRSLLPFEPKPADGRLAALEKIVGQREQLYKRGALSLGDLIQAKLDVCQAELDLADSDRQRTIVNGKIIKLKQELEDQYQKLFEKGAISREELLKAQADRFKAQQDLERIAKGILLEQQGGKERLAALKKVVEQQEGLFNAGRLTIQQLDEAKLKLHQTELDLAESDQQRVAALEQIVKLTKEVEEAYQRLHSMLRVTEDVVLKARADRLKAESDLKRAKQKAAGKKNP